MTYTRRHALRAFLACTAVLLAAWCGQSAARYQIGELEISGEFFMLFEAGWAGGQGPGQEFALAVAPGVFLGPTALGTPSNADKFDDITAFRKELSLEFVYRGIPHITPVLKLRPYYDSMFEINDKDNDIAQYWKTNLSSTGTLNDEWDPLVREAFVDFNFHPVFLRAGRQIVTWGRSDGVTVLDVVTPRNFRNPLTFEQERFMIPQNMLNFTYDLSEMEWLPGGITKEFQVIWNLDYTPSRFPGFRAREEMQHPWTLNVVDFANQVINVSENLFGEKNFFDGDRYDRGDTMDQSEVFVRWRARTGEGLGPLSDMTYSFHYAYLFDDLPGYDLQNRIDAGFAIDIAGPRNGFGGGINFDRHRYHLAGFSFDKALMFLPGPLQGTVLRGEVAYNIDNLYYEPDLALVTSDQLQTLVGLDQYLYLTPRSWVETPWFVSFQWWRDEITRDAGPGQFTNLGTPACDAQPLCGRTGYIIGGAYNLFNGLRDEDRNVLTLFMFNDFLPGKTLHVELFGLHELGDDQRATWFRGLVGYNFNSAVSARVGVNIIEGHDDAFFGQFDPHDSMFMEFKVTF